MALAASGFRFVCTGMAGEGFSHGVGGGQLLAEAMHTGTRPAALRLTGGAPAQRGMAPCACDFGLGVVTQISN